MYLIYSINSQHTKKYYFLLLIDWITSSSWITQMMKKKFNQLTQTKLNTVSINLFACYHFLTQILKMYSTIRICFSHFFSTHANWLRNSLTYCVKPRDLISFKLNGYCRLHWDRRNCARAVCIPIEFVWNVIIGAAQFDWLWGVGDKDMLLYDRILWTDFFYFDLLEFKRIFFVVVGFLPLILFVFVEFIS